MNTVENNKNDAENKPIEKTKFTSGADGNEIVFVPRRTGMTICPQFEYLDFLKTTKESFQ